MPRRAIAFDAVPCAAIDHSRFCTCSRNCSTTLFSSSPMLVSSTSFALAHSVLTSRLSSCARKSSRRPTGAALGDQLARLRDMRGEPVELLADVGLGGEQERLLMQPVGVEAVGGVEQRRDLLGEPRLDRLRLAAGRGFGARGQRRDLVEPRRQDLAERRRPRAGASSTSSASASSKPRRSPPSAAWRSSSRSSCSITSITPLSARMPSSVGGAASTLPASCSQRREHRGEHRLVDPHDRRHAFALDGEVGVDGAARQRLGAALARRQPRSRPSPAAGAAADRGPWH